MTPYELNLLIHIYTTPIRHPNQETKLYEETCNAFESEGVIEPEFEDPKCAHGYKLTHMGEAWLKSILSTPKPTLAFIDYKGDVIAL